MAAARQSKQVLPALEGVPRECYSGISYSRVFMSPKTQITITENEVIINDPSELDVFRFEGGSAQFSITITEKTKKKKIQYKSITIKRWMPQCPISGNPVIEPAMIAELKLAGHTTFKNLGIQFRVGYAYNCHQVHFHQHRRFNLKTTLYTMIGRRENLEFYLVVPIVDGRLMKQDMKDALYDRFGNIDIVNIIAHYYNQQRKKEENFDFYMDDTVINRGTLYHRCALVDLLMQGKLQIGIKDSNLIGIVRNQYDIIILNPEAYNHVSIYGTPSILKRVFRTCDDMMRMRDLAISLFLEQS